MLTGLDSESFGNRNDSPRKHVEIEGAVLECYRHVRVVGTRTGKSQVLDFIRLVVLQHRKSDRIVVSVRRAELDLNHETSMTCTPGCIAAIVNCGVRIAEEGVFGFISRIVGN